VGQNAPPQLTLDGAAGVRQSPLPLLTVNWAASDPNSDPMTVDLYWADAGLNLLTPLVPGLDAAQGTMLCLTFLPSNKPIVIYGVARDNKGAVSIFTSIPLQWESAAHSDWLRYR
jgi:hypothetical protein